MMRKKRDKFFQYVAMALVMIIVLFPFLIMITTSLKTNADAISLSPTVFPRHVTFEHYRDIFNPKIFPFLVYFKNSLILSLLVSSVSIAVGIFAAYALSRLNFMGKTVINSSFYTVYMFSGLLLIVPLFKIISGLGLYDTQMSLILSMTVQVLPTSIFMLKSYFDTIPFELEEAAMIDGLNRIQIIFRIILPLSISGIASVFVYAFMVSWNDYLFASIFLSSSGLFTLPIGLNALFSTPDYIWGRMMAASLITALPVVVMYSISEHFIKGNLVEGGVKG